MNNEEKILSILTQMQTQLSSLEQRMVSVEGKVDQLQCDMSEVKENVKYIWEDIALHEKRLDKIAR